MAPVTKLPIRLPRRVMLDELSSLLQSDGPFLSVYLPLGTDDERMEAQQAVDQADLSDADRSALEAALAAREDDDAAFVMLRSEGGHQLTRFYPEPVERPLITVDHVPRLAPLLEAEQRLLHHLLARVGDVGLEVYTFPRHGEPTLHRADERDPEGVAALIAAAAVKTDTRLVLLDAPEPMARQLHRSLVERLPLHIAVVVMGDDDDEDLDETAVRLVADHHARQTLAVIRMWKFERSHGVTEDDVADTIDALAGGRARLLLVNDDVDDQRQAWFGDAPDRIALDLERARPIGDDEVLMPGRLIDVLLRSAILRSVPLRVLPRLPETTLPGSVGVVLDENITSLDVGS